MSEPEKKRRRGKHKLQRWAQNKEFACVHEPDTKAVVAGETYMAGEWRERAFAAPWPLTVEIGCGQGLFSIDLARRFPERNFIGIDIKGHRFWRGAKAATVEGLGNAAFLRARVQWLDHFFAEGEVSRIWLTFSDPQLADKRGTKRMTSPYYLTLYSHVLAPDGTVEVKTDDPDFYQRTIDDAPAAGLEVLDACANVHRENSPHHASEPRFDAETARTLSFVTAYEKRWLDEGRRIHYLRLGKSREVTPDELERARTMLQGPRERTSPRFQGC